MNIVASLLQLERLYFQENEIHAAKRYLNQIFSGIDKSQVLYQQPQEHLFHIKQILYEKEKFLFSAENNIENFTLCRTLNDRCGNCLGLVSVYLSVSEYMNIPIRSLLFEGHISVGYVLNNDVLYYVEPTKYFNIIDPPVQFLYGETCKILDHEEFLAVHLSNHATHFYARASLMDDAVFLIDSALEIFPAYTAGWINRAAMMKQIENFKEMNRSLEIAKSLKPGGRYSQAIERIENNTTLVESVA
ncbi:MAG: hypothetical protein LBT05_08265 [Planctomycetaceae bacterium]|jgi:tetratricopeptide (TPR) repeat protein|nr:hypothetical protein [Planctomycetaceae bacterium]